MSLTFNLYSGLIRQLWHHMAVSSFWLDVFYAHASALFWMYENETTSPSLTKLDQVNEANMCWMLVYLEGDFYISIDGVLYACMFVCICVCVMYVCMYVVYVCVCVCVLCMCMYVFIMFLCVYTPWVHMSGCSNWMGIPTILFF